MFINRYEELNKLKELYNSDKFEFAVIYGRRRVGKSSLVIESIKDIPNSLYFLAVEQSSFHNISQLKNEIFRISGNDHILSLKDDWELIFKEIMNEFQVIIIDEFPYLIESDTMIKSIFQRIIDLHLSNSTCTLILMGSSIKMMENEVLGAKSPLYGRRTAQIKLNPLDFIYLKEFLPNYELKDLIRVFGVTGGIPYYLEQLDSTISFWENIDQKFLNHHSVLFAEGEFLLKQEFTQVKTYNGILQQIASGQTDIGKIKNKIKKSGDISSYLNNLSAIGLIERRLPLNEDIIKSRRGKYYLKDNFLKFWFNYIFQNKQGIIMKLPIINNIKSSFNSYMGSIFELFVKEILIYGILNNKIKFPFTIVKLESWWYKDIEIDLIGWNTGNYLFIEIKWQNLKEIDVKNIINKLIAKSNKSNFKGNFSYMIVAKNIEKIESIHIQNVNLLDLSVIEKWL